jgi:glycosyltransferase involved in cell wall biosynthesis
MRLVIDGQRLGQGRTGVGRCLEALLGEWATSGWPLPEVILALRDPGAAAAALPNRDSLRSVVIGPRNPGLAWETLGLRRLLRPDDVLLAPANLSPLNWRGKTVLIAYDTLPWSVAESFPWHVRWRFKWRYQLAAHRATHVVVPSQATARDVQRVHGVPEDRLTVAYPGPSPGVRPLPNSSRDLSAAREAAGLGRLPYFLFVGKRSRRRNVGAILEGFRRLRSELPEARLVFVGPRGGEPLPTDDPGVVECGHVGEPVLRGLLAGAVGLLYPSDHEGFGLPVVEAQASGCPVVTLRNSALVESAGDAALFLDAPDAANLALAMRRLLTDPAFRNPLVVLGLENARRFQNADFARAVAEAVRRVAQVSRVACSE